MHEFSMAADIVEAALAATGDRRSITAVHVELGSDGHLDADILVDAFEVSASGTAADGARLEVSPVPGRTDVAVTAVEVD